MRVSWGPMILAAILAVLLLSSCAADPADPDQDGAYMINVNGVQCVVVYGTYGPAGVDCDWDSAR